MLTHGGVAGAASPRAATENINNQANLVSYQIRLISWIIAVNDVASESHRPMLDNSSQ
jgi:hypothetical protein